MDIILVGRITLFAGILFSSSISFGQQMPKRTPEQKAQHQTQWMQKNLMINEEQSRKVYDVIYITARDQDNAKMNGAGNGEKKEIKRDEMEELKHILSPEQFQKYKEYLQEMKERKQERNYEMRQGNY